MHKIIVCILLFIAVSSYAYDGEVVYSDGSISVRAYCVKGRLWYSFSHNYVGYKGSNFVQVFDTKTGKPVACKGEN